MIEALIVFAIPVAMVACVAAIDRWHQRYAWRRAGEQARRMLGERDKQ